jgi:diguanylate cyclase (GGDEF)-like protein/PAS domain S-box-containing protein
MTEEAWAGGPLFDGALDAIVFYDAQGRVLRANRAAAAMLDYEGRRFAPRFESHVSPDERPNALSQFSRARSGASGEFETVYIRSDGNEIPVIVTLQPVVEADGVKGIFGIARDASAVRETEAALARSEQQFRSIFEYHYDAAVSINPRRKFGRVNVATERLTGYRNEELVGMTIAQIIAPDRLESSNASLERALAGETIEFDSVVLRKDGTRCETLVHAMPMIADGRVYGAFAFIKDVSLQRELERRNAELQRKLQEIAFHDALTGLANRSLLEEHVERAISRARRSGELLAVHYIDLDGFKPVNDQYGHAAGDEVLCEVARRFNRAVRDGDVVARIGGDEFVVLQNGITGDASIRALARRLLRSFHEPIALTNGASVRVGGSLGMAIFPRDGARAEALLQIADADMYRVKDAAQRGIRNLP